MEEYCKHLFTKFFTLMSLALLLFYFGCATSQDITLIDRKIASVSEEISKKQAEGVRELKNKDLNLEEELKAQKVFLAELSIQLRHEHEQLLTLKSALEDYYQLLDKTIKDNAKDNEGIKMRIDRLEAFSKAIENSLRKVKEDNNKTTDSQPATPISKSVPGGNAWEDLDEESFYNLAYQTFQKGEYTTAREIFSAFLDKYPKGKLSDNATFWIGECYYKTNNYEQAILEYEKVKQNYPSGDKVPSAIFKQALSFLKLNVKEEAKIILKQLIQHYPESEQAKMAEAELKRLE